MAMYLLLANQNSCNEFVITINRKEDFISDNAHKSHHNSWTSRNLGY